MAMAGETSKETGESHVEALVDELIRDIFRESGGSSEVTMRGMATTAALFETAFGSTRGGSRASVFERLVLAEAFATELAEALAPVLAEQLAPRVVKALEHTASEAAAKQGQADSNAGSGGQPRKPEQK